TVTTKDECNNETTDLTTTPAQSITVYPPILKASKSANKIQLELGETLTYTITIKNEQTNAKGTAYNVIVSDNIPSNFEYINATLDGNPIPNLSSNPYTFNVGKFTPSTTRSLVITVRAISSGDTINFATINGTYRDDSSISSKDSNNVSVKVLGAPQMSVSKEQNVTGSVEPGDLIKYTITVNNLQNVTSYNVNITDQIP
ncbi:MAG: hypothetical protein CVT89_09200, partial [Candidatus Altiarchaeales archaeon HGW-Altiarchaeales-2]